MKPRTAKVFIGAMVVLAVQCVLAQPTREDTLRYNDHLPNYFPLNRKNFVRVSSGYGYRLHPVHGKVKKHKGIDLVAKKGSAVHASASGSVKEVGFDKGYGNYVLLKHQGMTKTLYGHLLYFFVKKGDKVAKGQLIGAVGDSGWVTGPHLHYEIWIHNKRIDPMFFWNSTVIKNSIGNSIVTK
ncbi:MAG: M23 family metallopeptidase [Bacteroidota bacterium]